LVQINFQCKIFLQFLTHCFAVYVLPVVLREMWWLRIS
jgi:hypothetical protein